MANKDLIDKIGKIQHWQYSSKHAGWIKCEDEGVVFTEDLRKAIEETKAEEFVSAKLSAEELIKNRLAICSCSACQEWAQSMRKVLSTHERIST